MNHVRMNEIFQLRPKHKQVNDAGGVTLAEVNLVELVRMIPERHHHELLRYIERREAPRSAFLRCVLENDLTRAVIAATPEDERALGAYVLWLRGHAPGECWGSVKKVRKWIR